MSPFDVFDGGEVHTNTSPRHSPALAPRLRYRLLPEARMTYHMALYLHALLNVPQYEKHTILKGRSGIDAHFTLHVLLVA